MLRFMLRRDRIQLPIWILAITFSIVVSLVSFAELYSDEAERQAMTATMANPAAIALSGPELYLENYTIGSMISHQMIGIAGIVVALMTVFLIVRHTRKEEETGRAELVRASVVGRHAMTTAALILAVGVNLVLSLILAVSMGSLGIESVTWEGSFLFGAAMGSIGLAFAGIAIVFVQLMENARGATGLSAGVIAIAFSLRAIGDIGEGTLSWFSPIGWAQQTAAYVDNNWSPVFLSIAFMIVLVAIAYPLSTKRDVGAGMVRPRRGKANGSNLLTNPIGLAFRLQRTNLIIWSLAMMLFGLSYGAFIGEAEEMMASMGDAMDDMLPVLDGGILADSFAAMFISVSAMVACIPALQSILKLRGEEKDGRIESMLSGALSRTRLLGSYLIVALLSSVFLLFMAGFGMGITGSHSMNDSSYLVDLTIAGLAFTPALWVVVGFGAALIGLFPRGAAFSWALLIYAFLVVYLGGALQMPEWMMNVSPFQHVPRIPAEEWEWLPLLGLTGVAIVLIVIGLVAFRRRDVDL